jgi:hypothetical protein
MSAKWEGVLRRARGAYLTGPAASAAPAEVAGSGHVEASERAHDKGSAAEGSEAGDGTSDDDM